MKLIQHKPINIVIALAIIFTTNIFCMRMTQTQKKTARKYMQQMKTEPYKKASQKYMQRIKTELEATQKPVIFYSPVSRKIELNFVKDNTLINSPISPTQVSFYTLSPQKKYLIFQTTSPGKPKYSPSSLVGKIATQAKEKAKTYSFNKITGLTGYEITEKKIPDIYVTKIADLQTQTEVGSFDGDLITYEFSPDEKTVLISRRHMGNKLSNKGFYNLGARPRNDITRYELFDITSKSIIKSFENVHAISYTAEDTLHVQYDNHEVEKITIQRNTPSLTQQIKNVFSPQSSIEIVETKGSSQDIPNKITYYDAKKELQVSLTNKIPKSYTNIISYALSPFKNYLVLMKEPAIMNLIDMATGQNIENVCANTITYEFSPDQKETRLIVLGAGRDLFSGKNLQYSLVKLEKDRTRTLGTFGVDNKTYYFKSADELIITDKNGTFTPYNPQTGINFEKEQQEKREQEKEHQQKLQKQLEKEQLKEAEQRNEELNKQQQELQQYYEESPEAELKKESPSEAYSPTKKGAISSTFDYIKSFWSAPVKETTMETEVLPKEENISDAMDKFIENPNKSVVDAIINKLSQDNRSIDRKELVEKYNAYDTTIKKMFASYFFAAPHGDLQSSSGTTTYSQGKQFIAISKNPLQILNDNSREVVFTAEKLNYKIKAMTFSANDAYLAVSYETESNSNIDIFIKEKNSFVPLQQTLSQKLQLETENPIIGLKFITTRDNYTYLFFIDTEYQLKVFNLTEEKDFSKKQNISKKSKQPILGTQYR